MNAPEFLAAGVGRDPPRKAIRGRLAGACANAANGQAHDDAAALPRNVMKSRRLICPSRAPQTAPSAMRKLSYLLRRCTRIDIWTPALPRAKLHQNAHPREAAMTMLRTLAAVLAAACALALSPARAEMKSEWVAYNHGDTKLKAY